MVWAGSQGLQKAPPTLLTAFSAKSCSHSSLLTDFFLFGTENSLRLMVAANL